MKHIVLSLICMLLITACQTDRSNPPKDFEKQHVVLNTSGLQKRGSKAQFDVKVIARDEPYATYGKGGQYQLTYDLLLPNNEKTDRSLIVFLHPGAFIKGSKDDKLIQQFMQDFTAGGYATLAANYRLAGYSGGLGELVSQLWEPGKLAKGQIYNSLQDAHSLLAFCEANAEEWGIDPSRIYLAGYSAGAILALNYSFIDEREAFEFFEHQPDDCLDCGEYIGQSEEDVVQGKIRGLIAIAGGLFDLAHIEAKDHIPTLLIHGNEDDMVPFEAGIPFNKYKTEHQFAFGDNDIRISEEISRGLINHLSLEVYGSKQIFGQMDKNVRLLEIPNKGHEFSHSGEEYEVIFTEIEKFLLRID